MIDPLLINTVRVGELPSAPFELDDKVPHEIGDTLFQGTVQQLADTIGDYLGSLAGIAFNPTTVPDGGTLPVTTKNEWMLVGKGTFNNVGGGATIICTEELNALTSNGTYWSLAVEIPINVELAGITQNIRSGYTETTPSEDALFTEFAKYLKIEDYTAPSQLESEAFARLASPQQNFLIPGGRTAKWADVNGTLYYPEDATNLAEFNTFTQTGTTVIFKASLETNELVRIFHI